MRPCQQFPTLTTVEQSLPQRLYPACFSPLHDGTGSYPTHYILKHLHDYFPYGKTLREWYATNEDTERFQTTHHQRDTETTLDYRGARLYGGDVGRFLSLDPLAADFPTESAYLYVGGNPNIFIDPNGKEKIVVAGGEFDHPERYKYNFVETSIHQLKKMKQKAGTESVTWVVMAAGYSKKDIKKMKRIAKGLGVGFEIMESAQELTNYLNSKDKSTSELSDERTSDKITDLSVFAHGFTKSAEFAYNQGGLQSTYSWDSDQSEQLNSDAFESSNICFYTCNSATDSNDSFVGNSLIKSVSNSTKALSTMGYWGRSDYATVNEGESYYHKINRKVNGFNIYGSRSLPSLGTKDSRGTTSTKVTIKR